jgi:hypothetical protein
MTVMADALPDDPGTLKAMVLAERARAERLEQIIKELQRHRFGRRAETLPEDQLLLGLEEANQVEAAGEAAAERDVPAKRAERAASRRANRGSLPSHLPRIEMLVDIESHACPCCGGALHGWRAPARFDCPSNEPPRYWIALEAPHLVSNAWLASRRFGDGCASGFPHAIHPLTEITFPVREAKARNFSQRRQHVGRRRD